MYYFLLSLIAIGIIGFITSAVYNCKQIAYKAKAILVMYIFAIIAIIPMIYLTFR